MKKLIITLSVMLLAASNISADLSYRACKESDRPNSDGQYRRQIENPSTYEITPGFGVNDFTFNPDEIELTFTNKTSCESVVTTDIISVHAHNGDDDAKKKDRTQIEKNFSIGGGFSYAINVLERSIYNDSTQESDNRPWVFYGKILKLKDNFQFHLDKTAVANEDPFNGKNHNLESKLDGSNVVLGSAEKPCSNNKTGTKLTFSSEDKTGCLIQLTGTDDDGTEHEYSSNVAINSVEIGTATKYTSEKFNLIRLSDKKTVGSITLKFGDDIDGFIMTIYGLDGNVMTL